MTKNVPNIQAAARPVSWIITICKKVKETENWYSSHLNFIWATYSIVSVYQNIRVVKTNCIKIQFRMAAQVVKSTN